MTRSFCTSLVAWLICAVTVCPWLEVVSVFVTGLHTPTRALSAGGLIATPLTLSPVAGYTGAAVAAVDAPAAMRAVVARATVTDRCARRGDLIRHSSPYPASTQDSRKHCGGGSRRSRPHRWNGMWLLT